MKKICLACLAILFIFNLPSCMLPASTEESIKEETEATRSTSTPPEIAETDSVVMVAFADPVLEALMRATIGKSSGAISLAEAQSVTRLDLSNEWQKYETSQDVIRQISGLENFTNLEYLDLSYHSISDISSLQGLHKLKFLSLAGNQLVDLSPLSELTGLRSLILSDCTAEDYSPLANLSNLEVLVLDNSSISDLWALASLTNLKRLYLAKTSVEDWFVLSEIYPNLEQKDFILPSTLQELGFVMDNNSKQARFDSDEASVVINHSSWGMSEMEWDRDIIRISLYVDDQYKMSVGYYGDIDAYVVQIYTDGRMDVNYVYDAKTDNLNLGEEDRQRFAAIVGRVLGNIESEDVLLAPVSMFEDVIRQVFNLSPDTLFARLSSRNPSRALVFTRTRIMRFACTSNGVIGTITSKSTDQNGAERTSTCAFSRRSVTNTASWQLIISIVTKYGFLQMITTREEQHFITFLIPKSMRMNGAVTKI